jgi:hypothetical protein
MNVTNVFFPEGLFSSTSSIFPNWFNAKIIVNRLIYSANNTLNIELNPPLENNGNFLTGSRVIGFSLAFTASFFVDMVITRELVYSNYATIFFNSTSFNKLTVNSLVFLAMGKSQINFPWLEDLILFSLSSLYFL